MCVRVCVCQCVFNHTILYLPSVQSGPEGSGAGDRPGVPAYEGKLADVFRADVSGQDQPYVHRVLIAIQALTVLCNEQHTLVSTPQDPLKDPLKDLWSGG